MKLEAQTATDTPVPPWPSATPVDSAYAPIIFEQVRTATVTPTPTATISPDATPTPTDLPPLPPPLGPSPTLYITTTPASP